MLLNKWVPNLFSDFVSVSVYPSRPPLPPTQGSWTTLLQRCHSNHPVWLPFVHQYQELGALKLTNTAAVHCILHSRWNSKHKVFSYTKITLSPFLPPWAKESTWCEFSRERWPSALLYGCPSQNELFESYKKILDKFLKNFLAKFSEKFWDTREARILCRSGHATK